jgi:hypothetical protein
VDLLGIHWKGGRCGGGINELGGEVEGARKEGQGGGGSKAGVPASPTGPSHIHTHVCVDVHSCLDFAACWMCEQDTQDRRLVAARQRLQSLARLKYGSLRDLFAAVRRTLNIDIT